MVSLFRSFAAAVANGTVFSSSATQIKDGSLLLSSASSGSSYYSMNEDSMGGSRSSHRHARHARHRRHRRKEKGKEESSSSSPSFWSRLSLPTIAYIVKTIWLSQEQQQQIKIQGMDINLQLLLLNLSGAFVEGCFYHPSSTKRSLLLSTYTSWVGMIFYAISLAKESHSMGMLYILATLLGSYVTCSIGYRISSKLSAQKTSSATAPTRTLSEYVLSNGFLMTMVIYVNIPTILMLATYFQYPDNTVITFFRGLIHFEQTVLFPCMATAAQYSRLYGKMALDKLVLMIPIAGTIATTITTFSSYDNLVLLKQDVSASLLHAAYKVQNFDMLLLQETIINHGNHYYHQLLLLLKQNEKLLSSASFYILGTMVGLYGTCSILRFLYSASSQAFSFLFSKKKNLNNVPIRAKPTPKTEADSFGEVTPPRRVKVKRKSSANNYLKKSLSLRLVDLEHPSKTPTSATKEEETQKQKEASPNDDSKKKLTSLSKFSISSASASRLEYVTSNALLIILVIYINLPTIILFMDYFKYDIPFFRTLDAEEKIIYSYTSHTLQNSYTQIKAVFEQKILLPMIAFLVSWVEKKDDSYCYDPEQLLAHIQEILTVTYLKATIASFTVVDLKRKILHVVSNLKATMSSFTVSDLKHNMSSLPDWNYQRLQETITNYWDDVYPEVLRLKRHFVSSLSSALSSSDLDLVQRKIASIVSLFFVFVSDKKEVLVTNQNWIFLQALVTEKISLLFSKDNIDMILVTGKSFVASSSVIVLSLKQKLILYYHNEESFLIGVSHLYHVLFSVLGTSFGNSKRNIRQRTLFFFFSTTLMAILSSFHVVNSFFDLDGFFEAHYVGISDENKKLTKSMIGFAFQALSLSFCNSIYSFTNHVSDTVVGNQRHPNNSKMIPTLLVSWIVFFIGYEMETIVDNRNLIDINQNGIIEWKELKINYSSTYYNVNYYYQTMRDTIHNNVDSNSIYVWGMIGIFVLCSLIRSFGNHTRKNIAKQRGHEPEQVQERKQEQDVQSHEVQELEQDVSKSLTTTAALCSKTNTSSSSHGDDEVEQEQEQDQVSKSSTDITTYSSAMSTTNRTSSNSSNDKDEVQVQQQEQVQEQQVQVQKQKQEELEHVQELEQEQELSKSLTATNALCSNTNTSRSSNGNDEVQEEEQVFKPSTDTTSYSSTTSTTNCSSSCSSNDKDEVQVQQQEQIQIRQVREQRVQIQQQEVSKSLTATTALCSCMDTNSSSSIDIDEEQGQLILLLEQQELEQQELKQQKQHVSASLVTINATTSSRCSNDEKEQEQHVSDSSANINTTTTNINSGNEEQDNPDKMSKSLIATKAFCSDISTNHSSNGEDPEQQEIEDLSDINSNSSTNDEEQREKEDQEHVQEHQQEKQEPEDEEKEKKTKEQHGRKHHEQEHQLFKSVTTTTEVCTNDSASTSEGHTDCDLASSSAMMDDANNHNREAEPFILDAELEADTLIEEVATSIEQNKKSYRTYSFPKNMLFIFIFFLVSFALYEVIKNITENNDLIDLNHNGIIEFNEIKMNYYGYYFRSVMKN